MNPPDNPDNPPRAAIQEYLAALQISTLSTAAPTDHDDNSNNHGNHTTNNNNDETGKLPWFILVDDNMKATPSFLLASTTPPKNRHRHVNRSNSLPSVSARPPKTSSSSMIKKKKKNRSSEMVDNKMDVVMATTEKKHSCSSSLVNLLHPARIRKEKHDLFHDEEDDHRIKKSWCRWSDFSSGGHQHVIESRMKMNDRKNTPTSTRGKSHHQKSQLDQGVSLPKRTIEEEDASY
jgi:hypothetical protein